MADDRSEDVHEVPSTARVAGHPIHPMLVPFPIACGNCNSCRNELYSVCENSNPNANIAEALHGHSPAGMFGYSHMMGGYAGGQAEYARVPFADVGPIRVESDRPDESVLLLSDIFPTGFMGAEMADIEPGDVVAVWGAGPVGQFAIASAFMLGAERVIAIDQIGYGRSSKPTTRSSRCGDPGASTTWQIATRPSTKRAR